MFYVLTIPIILLLAYNLFRLRQIRLHDEVLYKFCQLRRDVVRTIDEDINGYSKQEYRQIRLLLDQLNSTIRNFTHMKKNIFTFKIFLELVKAYIDFNTKRGSKSIKRSENDSIVLLYTQYNKTLIDGFISYVPFLRYRLIVSLMYTLIKLLSLIGLKGIQNKAGNFLKHIESKESSVYYPSAI